MLSGSCIASRCTKRSLCLVYAGHHDTRSHCQHMSCLLHVHITSFSDDLIFYVLKHMQLFKKRRKLVPSSPDVSITKKLLQQ